MLHKITSLGEGLYQWEDNDTPIDEQTLKQYAKEFNNWDDVKVATWIDELKLKGNGNLEVTANHGVVVNLYELDYPQPKNPNKETQEMASHLDEYKDFVTQYLFPGAESEDIIIGTQEQVLHKHKPKETSWRQAFKVQPYREDDKILNFTFRGESYEVNRLGQIKTEGSGDFDDGWIFLGGTKHHWSNRIMVPLKECFENPESLEGCLGFDRDHGTVREWEGNYNGKLPRISGVYVTLGEAKDES